MKTVCKILRNFTVPNIEKNGDHHSFQWAWRPTSSFIIQLLKNGTVNLYQTSPSYSFDHCRQFALVYFIESCEYSNLNARFHGRAVSMTASKLLWRNKKYAAVWTDLYPHNRPVPNSIISHAICVDSATWSVHSHLQFYERLVLA